MPATPVSARGAAAQRAPPAEWPLRERLLLAQAVRKSGDNNWVSVSRAIKGYLEGHGGPRGAPTHGHDDVFSQRNCALQYAHLLETAGTHKRKRADGGPGEPVVIVVARRLQQEYIEELRRTILDEAIAHSRLAKEIAAIESGAMDDKLEEMLTEIERAEKEALAVAAASAAGPSSAEGAASQAPAEAAAEDKTKETPAADDSQSQAVPMEVDAASQQPQSAPQAQEPLLPAAPVASAFAPAPTPAAPAPVQAAGASATPAQPSASVPGAPTAQEESKRPEAVPPRTEVPAQPAAVPPVAAPATPAQAPLVLAPQVPAQPPVQPPATLPTTPVAPVRPPAAPSPSPAARAPADVPPRPMYAPPLGVPVVNMGAPGMAGMRSPVGMRAQLPAGGMPLMPPPGMGQYVPMQMMPGPRGMRPPVPMHAQLPLSPMQQRPPAPAAVSPQPQARPPVPVTPTPLQPSPRPVAPTPPAQAVRANVAKRPREEESPAASAPSAASPAVVAETPARKKTRQQQKEEAEAAPSVPQTPVPGKDAAVATSTPMSAHALDTTTRTPDVSGMAEGDSAEQSPATTAAWKKAMLIVWRNIANHKYASVFMRPVTDETYLELIRKPLDLVAIKKRLEDGTIRTSTEFLRDMYHMFQNALMFNDEEHDVHQMAIEMRDDVTEQVMQFMRTEALTQREQQDEEQLALSQSVGSAAGDRKTRAAEAKEAKETPKEEPTTGRRTRSRPAEAEDSSAKSTPASTKRRRTTRNTGGNDDDA